MDLVAWRLSGVHCAARAGLPFLVCVCPSTQTGPSVLPQALSMYPGILPVPQAMGGEAGMGERDRSSLSSCVRRLVIYFHSLITYEKERILLKKSD